MPIDALPALRDKRVLVVEDEDLVARELRHDLEDMGAHVLGPVPSVALALAMLAQSDGIDGAILDINLRGETVFPVAGALHARHVPFVFWTGYDTPALPGDFDGAPCLRKPAPLAEVVRLLLRDLARARPSAAVLADVYLAADGAHLLALREGGVLLDDARLTWVGAAFVNAGDWSRRLRAPLLPGVAVRVPWRHIAGLRHQLAVMG